MTLVEDDKLKEKSKADWTIAAQGWRKHDARLASSTAVLTSRMLTLAGVRDGHRVLDIASGTGEPAIPAAEWVGPHGYVLGTDLVEEMLVFAREKATRRRLKNVEFQRQDGEALVVPPGSFDAALIRWGLMSMPRPEKCLAGAYAALKRGGRIAVACWSGPEHNPWVTVPLSVIERYVEVPDPRPGTTGPFAFADPHRLSRVLQSAGFSGVDMEEVQLWVGGVFDDAAAWFEYTREMSGLVSRLWAQLSPVVRRRVESEIIREVDGCRRGTSIALRGVTWVAHGGKRSGG